MDSKDIADTFNQYFISVFNKKNLNSTDAPMLLNHRNDYNNPTILFENQSVVKSINSFKKNKSPGVDGITSTYVLKIKEIIAGPLECIFNRSFQYCEKPKDWKHNTNI